MADGISIEIQWDQLKAKLSALSSVLGPAALDPALLSAGWLVANDAKATAPYKSGTLRRSIEPQIVEPGQAVVGSSVPYARRIEYGFAQADRRGRHYNQAAKPYLRPAFEQNRGRVRAAIVQAARDLIRRTLE